MSLNLSILSTLRTLKMTKRSPLSPPCSAVHPAVKEATFDVPINFALTIDLLSLDNNLQLFPSVHLAINSATAGTAECALITPTIACAGLLAKSFKRIWSLDPTLMVDGTISGL